MSENSTADERMQSLFQIFYSINIFYLFNGGFLCQDTLAQVGNVQDV